VSIWRGRSGPSGRWLLVALAVLASGGAPALPQVGRALAEAQIDLLPEAPDDNFGWSVANAGDVNGDGRPDVIVGAIYNDSAAKDAGEAYIFLGGPGVSTIPFVTMTGMAANDQFGVSVAGAGDFNGDRYADVIVGARLNRLNGTGAGAAFIYFGGPAMDGIPDVILTGEAAGDWFGNSVAGAGDLNGDGYSDAIVGAPYNDRGGSAAGAAYVFFGGPPLDGAPDAVLAGELHDDQFGWSVAGAGDADGDGRSDVLVGARMHCVDQALCAGASYARGRAYLFRGGWPMDAVPDLVLDGDATNDWFGNTVAGIGDVDGDGRDDIAVGAIYADPVADAVVLSAAGTTSIYLGGSPMDPLRDALLPGEQANAQAGWAIAPAGDADGDGRADFWTTAHFYDDGLNTGAGKIDLFRGGPLIGPLPMATAVGDGKDVQMGQSIAGGDVSGSGGLADGIAGEVYSRAVGPGSGKTFILSPFCVRLSPDTASISWTSCASFGSYNLYRGSVGSDLPLGSYGTCALSGLRGFSIPQDSALPSPGDAFFYLITGRTPVMEGALGFDSSGALRRNANPCP
jgi:hypothetical protein